MFLRSAPNPLAAKSSPHSQHAHLGPTTSTRFSLLWYTFTSFLYSSLPSPLPSSLSFSFFLLLPLQFFFEGRRIHIFEKGGQLLHSACMEAGERRGALRSSCSHLQNCWEINTDQSCSTWLSQEKKKPVASPIYPCRWTLHVSDHQCHPPCGLHL